MVYVNRFLTVPKGTNTPPPTLSEDEASLHTIPGIAHHVPLPFLRGAVLDHLVCVVAEARSGVVGSDLPLQPDLGLLLVVYD